MDSVSAFVELRVYAEFEERFPVTTRLRADDAQTSRNEAFEDRVVRFHTRSADSRNDWLFEVSLRLA